jgi:hypothetical protein
MNSDLHPPIGDVLRKWLSIHIKSFQPRLCSEFTGVIDNSLFELILQAIIAWDTNHIFIFVSDESGIAPKIVGKSDLQDLLIESFSSGNTVTIVDPTNGSGCTIDWEGYDDEEDSEVLVVAWGEHEAVAQDLVNQLGAGSVFRGN